MQWLQSCARLGQLNDLAAPSQFVESIRPPRHELEPLLPKLRPRISSPNQIPLDMRQLCLDSVGVPFSAFVEHRRGGGAEAVGGHLVLGVAEAPQGRVECVLRKRSAAAAQAREDQFGVAGDRMRVFQHGEGLMRERDAMRAAELPAFWWERPNGRLEIALRPLGATHFTGPDESKGKQPEAIPDFGSPAVPVD